MYCKCLYNIEAPKQKILQEPEKKEKSKLRINNNLKFSKRYYVQVKPPSRQERNFLCEKLNNGLVVCLFFFKLYTIWRRKNETYRWTNYSIFTVQAKKSES